MGYMRYKKIIFGLLSVTVFCEPAFLNAQSNAPKYSNEFLAVGVGARALGMGNAYVAISDDITSGYWNPAGLLGIKSNAQLSLMHAEYFAGIAKYDYAGFAVRVDSSSVLAFSAVRFGVDNIANTTDLIDANGFVNYDNITSFSAADYAFLFSYTKQLGIPGLRIGANAKVIRRIVGSFAGAWGFGLDAGAQYDYKKWKFGLMARDITSTFNAWSYNLSSDMQTVFQETGNEIPQNGLEITLPRVILGAARKNYFYHNKISLLTELDVDLTFDGRRNVLFSGEPMSADPHIGFELGYLDMIFLRAGINNIQESTDINGLPVTNIQPNMGVGIKIKAFTIDYALSNIGSTGVGLYSNIFSLKFDINKIPK